MREHGDSHDTIEPSGTSRGDGGTHDQSRREPQVKSPRTTQKVKSPGTTRQTTSAEMPGDANRAIKMQIEEIEANVPINKLSMPSCHCSLRH